MDKQRRSKRTAKKLAARKKNEAKEPIEQIDPANHQLTGMLIPPSLADLLSTTSPLVKGMLEAAAALRRRP